MHPSLPNNRTASLRRFQSLVKRLRGSGKLEEYNEIIKEQLEQGVVEEAPSEVVGREYYMPHRAVIRENVETTKTRIVYDCSGRAEKGSPSLNDCLETGPALQNKLWDVLVRNRFRPVILAGDMKKAFLQVRIRKEDRDALRFLWLRSFDSNEAVVLRFTRALFGMVSSPFLLGGVIEQHLASWSSRLPDRVQQISKDLYVDDLISGASTVPSACELKRDALTIFEDASFQLHKWNSNVPELEADQPVENDATEQTYAKQQFSPSCESGSKLLGVAWDKREDTLSVVFPQNQNASTKREVLAKLASVYDPLGLASPTLLQGKLLYRDACESKMPWDSPLPDSLAKRWKGWESSLPSTTSTQRSLATYREPIQAIELHSFGDASGHGVAAAVYAVIRQQSGTTQGLVAAKSRLAKQGLTIPRLELVGAHMAANIVDNVRRALVGFPLTLVQCWIDSTVALHWIVGNGEYRQFVANRVRKIADHDIHAWRHVPSGDNPADLGSRGGSVVDSELWWNGPKWLSQPEMWPSNPATKPSVGSTSESKLVREVIANVTVNESDEFDELLERCSLKKTLRVGAYIKRFLEKCRGRQIAGGPLTTEEIEAQMTWWIRRVQLHARTSSKFPTDELQLNLQVDAAGLLVCRGRILGRYPIYLPDSCAFTEKLVEREHHLTLHGGVGLTMARVREKYWVPRLRQMARKVIKSCWGCKRFQARALAVPPPGPFPKERTEGSAPFEIVGVDFAGPIRYRKSPRVEGKAYLVLYACGLSRALHLEILPNLDTSTFLGSLKRLIARRGRPVKMVSDNGRTFVGAARWLKQIRNDEQLQGYLADEQILWQFNLSRAPWWGGQFERLVGIFKRAFHKCVGGATLSWSELAEVVLDVEIQLNGRPLSYVEEDIDLPLLTPASFLFQRTNRLPEQEIWRGEDGELRKRARYLRSCKEALWKRWTGEYLTALRERHNNTQKKRAMAPAVGDVVIIRSDERNRGKWPLGIMKELFPGRDGIIRAVKLRSGRSHLERAVQHLYPLELKCETKHPTTDPRLDPNAGTFRPIKRDAAVAAKLRVEEIVRDDLN